MQVQSDHRDQRRMGGVPKTSGWTAELRRETHQIWITCITKVERYLWRYEDGSILLLEGELLHYGNPGLYLAGYTPEHVASQSP